jgi:hypothetical protein
MLLCSSISVHTKDCMDLKICVVRPPVYAEPLASISVLVSSLGMHALALQKWPLLKLENALSCSLSNVSTTQQWVHPPTLIDLMREGEKSLHPMVEVR